MTLRWQAILGGHNFWRVGYNLSKHEKKSPICADILPVVEENSSTIYRCSREKLQYRETLYSLWSLPLVYLFTVVRRISFCSQVSYPQRSTFSLLICITSVSDASSYSLVLIRFLRVDAHSSSSVPSSLLGSFLMNGRECSRCVYADLGVTHRLPQSFVYICLVLESLLLGSMVGKHHSLMPKVCDSQCSGQRVLCPPVLHLAKLSFFFFPLSGSECLGDSQNHQQPVGDPPQMIWMDPATSVAGLWGWLGAPRKLEHQWVELRTL